MPKTMTLYAVLLCLILTAGAFAQDPAGDEFSRDRWGSRVGFAPTLDQPGYTPGLTIDRSNLDAFKPLLSLPAAILVGKYGMVIDTASTRPDAPSDGYIAATNAHWRQVRLLDVGAADRRDIEGYEGGLPFPAPDDGRKIAWNHTLAYTGDDGENEFKVFWISAARGVERSEEWRTTAIHKVRFRTDIEPRPVLTGLADQGIYSATLTTALSPADKKGLSSLYYGYYDLKEPDGWLYNPAQRRPIRFSFGRRGLSWNNTDLLYEDVGGYTGRPEWMNWKLLDKATLLAPVHAGVPVGKGREKEVYNFDDPPYFCPRMTWELRPMYVVEAVPKDPQYPYSRMVFTIDAESFHIYSKAAYDKKGALWKILINATNESPDPTAQPLAVALSLIVDLQAEHATAFFWHAQRNNIGLKPSLFTLASLRKISR